MAGAGAGAGAGAAAAASCRARAIYFYRAWLYPRWPRSISSGDEKQRHQVQHYPCSVEPSTTTFTFVGEGERREGRAREGGVSKTSLYIFVCAALYIYLDPRNILYDTMNMTLLLRRTSDKELSTTITTSPKAHDLNIEREKEWHHDDHPSGQKPLLDLDDTISRSEEKKKKRAQQETASDTTVDFSTHIRQRKQTTTENTSING